MRKQIFTAAALLLSAAVFAEPSISPKDAIKYIGDKVTVCGKISGSKKDASKSTVISLGTGTATSQMTIVINQTDLKNFPYRPDEYLINKNVCVSGRITDQNGKPEMLVRGPESIKIDEEVSEVEIRPLGVNGLNRYFEE